MPAPFPKIAIVGSGAVGCYYGARLALSGANVSFLMRGDLRAVRERGSIVVRDTQGSAELRPVAAFGSAAEIGPVDLVVVALKSTSGGSVEALVNPLLAPHTAILTLQNGFGADEYLAGLFGANRIMGGLVFMAITRTGPGEIRCFSPGAVSIGEFERMPVGRTRNLVALLAASGFKAEVVRNLVEARWRKLMWNIPFNGLSITEGAITTDKICSDPRLAAEARALMLEVQTAAAGFGIVIPDEFLEKQFIVTPPMGLYQPSSLVDFLAGREVEVEPIWGEPLRRARSVGVAMPRLASLYARLTALCPGAMRPLIP
jgi:2-dehydropantoate 2-reductase